MVEKRNIVTCIILSIVTCGIYGIYWFIVMTDDVRALSGDERLSGGKSFLFSLITCGIYSFYWCYLMAKAISNVKVSRGLAAEDNAILYIILQIFGFGIVNYCLIQNDINTLSDTK